MAFDDFDRERREQQAKKERLAADTPAELEALKGFISEFAARSVDGNQFVWTNNVMGDPMLRLKNVAATVSAREPRKKCEITFGRIVGLEYNTAMRTQSITWEITPDIVNDNFVWRINGDDGSSAAQLADAIATQLARFHVDYEESHRLAS
jgi:hypothetical protein